jgi:hypothetical protein
MGNDQAHLCAIEGWRICRVISLHGTYVVWNLTGTYNSSCRNSCRKVLAHVEACLQTVLNIQALTVSRPQLRVNGTRNLESLTSNPRDLMVRGARLRVCLRGWACGRSARVLRGHASPVWRGFRSAARLGYLADETVRVRYTGAVRAHPLSRCRLRHLGHAAPAPWRLCHSATWNSSASMYVVGSARSMVVETS